MRHAQPKIKPLEIIDDKYNGPNGVNLREGAFPIPIDILEQKLMLHKGLVMVAQGERQKAKSFFVECINTGSVYDARISKECCN